MSALTTDDSAFLRRAIELAALAPPGSGEPCPMCLAACMWASLSGIVYAATVEDAAAHGFRDQELYRQIAFPNSRRALRMDAAPETVRTEAVRTMHRWHAEKPDSAEAGQNPA